MAFTSSTIVKNHLVISGSTFDTLIAQLITQVDDLITERTGVPTGASAAATISDEIVSAEESYIGGKYRTRAKHHPITELTKIEYRDANADWEEYDDETISDVEFEDDSIYTKYLMIGEGERKIRLNYKAGYATASVPDDLNLAATLIVCHLFNNRNTIGNDNVTVLGLQQTMTKTEYLYVKQILTKYKIIYAL